MTGFGRLNKAGSGAVETENSDDLAMLDPLD